MKIGSGMKISGVNSCLTFKSKKKMKKILFMVAAVVVMAMVSCNKENTNEGTEVKEPSVVVEFSASISMGPEDPAVQPQSSAATRTTVDHSVLKNPKTLWLDTDKISINGVAFKVKELINGGASATFVNVVDLPADFGAPYTAVYPYAAAGDDKKITLPALQTAKAGDFPEDAVCAAAYSEDAVLKFKNVASVLMFQVAEACQTVTISSDNALAGTVTMTPNGDDKVPTFGEGTEKTVTINGPFTVGQNYYVAVLPGTKANFVVSLDGQVSRSALSINITRSGFADMKVLPAPVLQLERGLSFSDASVSVTYGDAFTAPTLSGEKTGAVYTSSNTSVATVNPETGEVTLVAGGETIITATADATETLKAGTASYTLTVAKAQRNLAFSKTSATATYGSSFTAPTLTGETEGVIYTSLEPTVATIDPQTGEVTLVAGGETTITATVAETATHLSGTASYTLIVELPLADWNLIGAIGTINMEKSTIYTDLYVAKNVQLSSEKKFRFVNKDKTKTVGAYGNSGADVDTKGQINSWYESAATVSYAANIYVSTTGNYDVYFSPANLDFLIIEAGVEEKTSSKWAMVGWFGSESPNSQDKWSYSKGIKFNYNYVLCAHTLTRKLTSSDYFLFVADTNWSEWIGASGNEYGNNGRNTKNYSINKGETETIALHNSYNNEKAQFHMNNDGNYKIVINVGNKYESVTVKFTRIE